MARSGMASLIRQIRAMTGAEAGAYMVDTQTLWDDDRVQEILDRNRQDFYAHPLAPIPTYEGGTVAYYTYRAGRAPWEAGAAFVVKDPIGTTLGTAAYTADHATGVLTFAADTLGDARYLTGRVYDLHGAAADLCEAWAAALAREFDFAEGNKDFKRSQQYKALLDMAARYRATATPTTARLVRRDLTPC